MSWNDILERIARLEMENAELKQRIADDMKKRGAKDENN